MKLFTGKGFATAEILFVGAYLAVYAFLLLVSDPEWLMWAGPVTLGAFPVTAPGVSLAFDPREIFQVASYSVLLGLLALIILARIRVEAHGALEHRKAA
jgi:hypothetical protein